MAGDHRDDFHIKTGRSRSRGTGVNPRSPPFVRQVETAIPRVIRDYDFAVEHDRKVRQGFYPSRVLIARK